MAEKARFFQDLDAAELAMFPSNPREHKHIGRGVHNFDFAIWGRIREEVVLAATFDKFTLNPAMNQHQLSTGTNCLAVASPFDPARGISLHVDDLEARGPCRW